MPIYEYRCDACGHELEKIQKMADPALTECPQCGKSTLKKLVSASGFKLKGTGWYATDFKDNDKAKKKKAAKATSTDSKTKPATKSKDAK